MLQALREPPKGSSCLVGEGEGPEVLALKAGTWRDGQVLECVFPSQY